MFCSTLSFQPSCVSVPQRESLTVFLSSPSSSFLLISSWCLLVCGGWGRSGGCFLLILVQLQSLWPWVSGVAFPSDPTDPTRVEDFFFSLSLPYGSSHVACRRQDSLTYSKSLEAFVQGFLRPPALDRLCHEHTQWRFVEKNMHIGAKSPCVYGSQRFHTLLLAYTWLLAVG